MRLAARIRKLEAQAGRVEFWKLPISVVDRVVDEALGSLTGPKMRKKWTSEDIWL